MTLADQSDDSKAEEVPLERARYQVRVQTTPHLPALKKLSAAIERAEIVSRKIKKLRKHVIEGIRDGDYRGCLLADEQLTYVTRKKKEARGFYDFCISSLGNINLNMNYVEVEFKEVIALDGKKLWKYTPLS
jgi:hypothetical protein